MKIKPYQLLYKYNLIIKAMSYLDNQELLTISNTRFRNEIKYYLYDNIDNNLVIYRYINDEANFILLNDDKIYRVKIKIDNNYPFKAPKVEINDMSYWKMLKIPQNMTNDLGVTCLCCQTILCNWTPVIRISKIFAEIKNVLDIRRRIVDRIFCRHIQDKFFGFYIPIIEFL